jgi:hypothetical protein
MLIGTLVRLSAEWRVPATATGTLTDPTAVTLDVRLPSGALVSSVYGGATGAGTIVKDATGQYHADYLPLTAGTHRYRWAGTGPAYASAEGSFAIDASSL